MAANSSVPPAPASCPPLPVEGPLVISTITDWHRRMLDLAAAPATALDLRGVTEIDLFGLQLLLSARRSATEQGRPFTLVNPPPAFTATCTTAGLSPTLFSAP